MCQLAAIVVCVIFGVPCAALIIYLPIAAIASLFKQ